MKLFARKGEAITCEKGHVICTVAYNIPVADIYMPSHLINWNQPEPKMGDSDVKCAKCGSLFWHGYKGQHFHFWDGWRETEPLRHKETRVGRLIKWLKKKKKKTKI